MENDPMLIALNKTLTGDRDADQNDVADIKQGLNASITMTPKNRISWTSWTSRTHACSTASKPSRKIMD
jgi:hypothetical protein